jgi:hypothetical protein
MMADDDVVVSEVDAPAVVEDDKSKPYKAYVGAALTVVAFVIAFVVHAWLTDGTPKKVPIFTQQEFKDAVQAGFAAGIASSGLVGGGVFLKGNPKRVKPQHRR